MQDLELLAPARDAEIGIAAIDCGADAVYIAGEAFGARQAAGNSMEDIRRLCAYAHPFGVRIYLTLNTILYDDELDRAAGLLIAAREAGVDAVIVQDPAVITLARERGVSLPLHASTQFAVRTPERARLAEALGFSRIVPERQLSLGEIRAIREAVSTELECFVHGALCVAYSGQCYLSEYLTRRSANRGACAQACRSLYDLVDADGKVLLRGKALLSLKDLRLKARLEELAGAGVSSFKIEGRLKNISYVRNVVRDYSLALDALVEQYPDRYRRASFGRVTEGFTPDTAKTFNRGYTELFLDGKRGKWSSMDAPKSMGEAIGTVYALQRDSAGRMQFGIRPLQAGLSLRNGDGFAFVSADGVTGFRGDVCEGLRVRCKDVPGLREGMTLYRNIDTAFEKILETQPCRREIPVSLDVRIEDGYRLELLARTQDGREGRCSLDAGTETARNRERAGAMLREQLSKRSGIYRFSVGGLEIETPGGDLPLLSAATLNGLRRRLAETLDAVPVRTEASPAPTAAAAPTENRRPGMPTAPLSYKDNIANAPARERLAGTEACEAAYELTHRRGVELMRSKYCIRYELGLCLRDRATTARKPIFLHNNGRRLPLRFDCEACEMAVLDE